MDYNHDGYHDDNQQLSYYEFMGWDEPNDQAFWRDSTGDGTTSYVDTYFDEADDDTPAAGPGVPVDNYVPDAGSDAGGGYDDPAPSDWGDATPEPQNWGDATGGGRPPLEIGVTPMQGVDSNYPGMASPGMAAGGSGSRGVGGGSSGGGGRGGGLGSGGTPGSMGGRAGGGNTINGGIGNGNNPYQAAIDQGTRAQIASSYQQQYNTARAANETRYNDILSKYDAAIGKYQTDAAGVLQGYQDRYNTGIAALTGLGDTARSDANRQFNQLGARTTQSAISRGLGNTTVRDALGRGVEQERQVALGRINEAVRTQTAGIQSQLSGEQLAASQRFNDTTYNLHKGKLDFMERRQDEYPNMQQLLALSQGLGGAGAGGTSNSGGYASMYGAPPLGVPNYNAINQAAANYYGSYYGYY